MVYREPETRHPQPLRLGSEETDKVVERHRIGCSHWDAVRFFTPAARPLNTLRPFKDDRAVFEQPACLRDHVDLYKHAYRLADAVGSDLVADAFELAWDVRIDEHAGDTVRPHGRHHRSRRRPVDTHRDRDADGKREYGALQRVRREGRADPGGAPASPSAPPDRLSPPRLAPSADRRDHGPGGQGGATAMLDGMVRQTPICYYSSASGLVRTFAERLGRPVFNLAEREHRLSEVDGA